MEPKIAPEATAALFSPDAGTLIPYEYTIALAENAADNGVEVITPAGPIITIVIAIAIGIATTTIVIATTTIVIIITTIVVTTTIIAIVFITGAHAAGSRRHLQDIRRVIRGVDLALGAARVRQRRLVVAA